MQDRIILGMNVKDRLHDAPEVQKLLTEYGCYIKTRIGLHEVDENMCSTAGLIVLELFGENRKCLELTEKLAQFTKIELQKMVFTRA